MTPGLALLNLLGDSKRLSPSAAFCASLPNWLSASVTGPKSVKSGAKGTFKVKVTNKGTGVAKSVSVTGTGGAKGSTKNINPDTAKTVTVKAKVTGRKGSKKTLTFTAKSGKSTAKAKIKVTVK